MDASLSAAPGCDGGSGVPAEADGELPGSPVPGSKEAIGDGDSASAAEPIKRLSRRATAVTATESREVPRARMAFIAYPLTDAANCSKVDMALSKLFVGLSSVTMR